MLMTEPTLRQLHTFIAVIEAGSITEAARSLNLTQPAASQQLRELQRTLGARLFDRAEGRVVPTAAGAAILDHARRAHAAAADIVAVAAAYHAGGRGRVRLGTGATACIYFLPRPLAEARRRMPGIEIVVETGNTPEIIRRVEDASFDAGLVTMPARLARALDYVRVRRDPLAALVPQDCPSDGPLSPRDLARGHLILYEKAGLTRSIIDAWFAAAGIPAKPIMELGSVEAIKVLVGSGLGASVLPSLALDDLVPGTRVRALSPPLARDLALVIRKGKVLDRSLRTLIDALHEQHGPMQTRWGCV
jgi:DNA-binding transcriptional LysR family regulator